MKCLEQARKKKRLISMKKIALVFNRSVDVYSLSEDFSILEFN